MSLLVQAADYLGNYALSSIVYFKFSVTDATGVLTTLGGTPAVKVYKDNGTTESTAGVTLTVDFDSRTGLCQVAIDTSSDGTFYAGGHDFEAVITAGTVGIVSVAGTPVGHFSLLNRVDTLADGVTHGGPPSSSTATIAFSRMVGHSQSSNAAAFSMTGLGAAPGMYAEGDNGIRCVGGDAGMSLSGGALGLQATGISTAGASFTGDGTKPGLITQGGSAGGHGWVSQGGGASGAGTRFLGGTDADGFQAQGAGGGRGLFVQGGENGAAASVFNGGGGGGSGLQLFSDGASALFISVFGDGGNGVEIVSSGVGNHDIALTGSGDILGNLAGTIDGVIATGLDNILIDGKTLRAALQIIAALVAGKVSGAGTSTEVFKGLDGSTTRASMTVDASGNRTGASYP